MQVMQMLVRIERTHPAPPRPSRALTSGGWHKLNRPTRQVARLAQTRVTGCRRGGCGCPCDPPQPRHSRPRQSPHRLPLVQQPLLVPHLPQRTHLRPSIVVTPTSCHRSRRLCDDFDTNHHACPSHRSPRKADDFDGTPSTQSVPPRHPNPRSRLDHPPT